MRPAAGGSVEGKARRTHARRAQSAHLRDRRPSLSGGARQGQGRPQRLRDRARRGAGRRSRLVHARGRLVLAAGGRIMTTAATAVSGGAREAMERLNAEAAPLNIWLRTQANAPAQRLWFRDAGLAASG